MTTVCDMQLQHPLPHPLQSVAELSRVVDDVVSFDVSCVDGAEAVKLLDVMEPQVRRLTAFRDAVVGRIAETNAHVAEGAVDGVAYIAAKTGSSARSARTVLKRASAVRSLPELSSSLLSGDVSTEQAEVIVRVASGDEAVARELLDVAPSATTDELARHGQAIRARNGSASRQERLRRSQFVTIERDADSMVIGSFKLLPQHAAGILAIEREIRGSTWWQRAESFASLVGNGSNSSKTRPSLVFHLDLQTSETADLTVFDRCEQVGVGPVALSSISECFETASRLLVGTVNNKLTWFSETDLRRKDVELPESVKRAIRSAARDVCEAPGCVNIAIEVDHITARVNGGIHELENLEALCATCHDAKTRRDAPWTVGGIFGPDAKWRQKAGRVDDVVERGESAARCTTPEMQLFPTTGCRDP